VKIWPFRGFSPSSAGLVLNQRHKPKKSAAAIPLVGGKLEHLTRTKRAATELLAGDSPLKNRVVWPDLSKLWSVFLICAAGEKKKARRGKSWPPLSAWPPQRGARGLAPEIAHLRARSSAKDFQLTRLRMERNYKKERKLLEIIEPTHHRTQRSPWRSLGKPAGRHCGCC